MGRHKAQIPTMSDDFKSPSLDTLFAQADGALDPTTGAVVPSIPFATTFARDEHYDLTSPDHSYARDQNDLFRLAERILTRAEGGAEGLLFPSGMAAIAALIRGVPNGGRIILQSGIYWGATKFIRDFCARRDVALTEVDCSDLSQLEGAVKNGPVDLVWVETPSNPYLKITDIAGAATIAGTAGATLAVDSTAATPCTSRPLELGADIVMHSATKAINGHSDVLAGFIACRDAQNPLFEFARTDRQTAGALLGSMEAWLLIRGMRTLPLRMERMCANAMAVARFLDAQDAVSKVLYPGLATDPAHDLATRQMPGGYGSLLSCRIAGGRDAALAVVGKMKLFKRATSLGGVESLVEHRHTIEDTVPDDLLRLSCGIEHEEDLIADLQLALG